MTQTQTRASASNAETTQGPNMIPRGLSFKKGRVASSMTAYSLLIVATVIMVGPLFYIVSTSLKQTTQLFAYPPDWIPKILFWGNYSTLIGTDSLFLRWTVNTLLVAGVVTILKLIIDSMAGYAFAKIDFPGRKTLFILVLAVVMVPTSAVLIPLFLLVRGMGILDTYWALILPPLANPVGVFLMRNYIQSLPRDLENSARLDGCSEFSVYLRIVLPLVKPGLVVLGILTFLAQYTAFLWPLLAVQDERLQVLTTGVAEMKASIFTVDWGLISAASVLSMVPITLMFFIFQRYFSGGSIAGALKQ